MSEKQYPDDELCRFHWLDGSKSEGYGRDPSDAVNRMGYGAGALRALDYYEKAQPVPTGEDRMSEWQPIETAPRDGTSVLLWIPGRVRVALGRWYPDKYAKRPRPYWDWCSSVTDCRVFSPTHWHPLPPPPSETMER